MVSAEVDGVVITRGRGSLSLMLSRFERILPALLLQLEDMEIGSKRSETSWCIPYTEFAELESREIDAFENLCRWSPFTLELDSTRWLGAPDFRYQYRFFQGRLPVPVERRGCFVCFHSDIFRLDADSFKLLEAIDGFNAAESGDRKSSAFLQFSRIKGLASSVGARLDKYLSAERVLLPSKLGVDIVAEEDGRISFVPKVDGVPQDELTRAFFAADDIESIYAVDDGVGRIRVIFDDTQQEVLRRIQRVRHIGGQRKATVMRDPSTVFDGVSGAVEFAFGPRVTGIGDFPFTAKPYLDARTGIFDGLPPVAPRTPEYGLECRYTDGTSERVRFSSRQELLQFRNNVADARSRGLGVVDMNGRSISVNSELESSLDELIAVDNSRPTQPREPKQSGQYVLILTNEERVDYQGADDDAETSCNLSLPTAFGAEAKPHQSVGFQWLRKNYERRRSGCFLADDMGLGKTLQVLLFLASLIESGDLSEAKGSGRDLPPWNPILVVAPVILIENSTWESDMRTFFGDEGAIFEPLLVLHGAVIKQFRSPDVQGRETALGQAALRLDALRKYKVILTNYETVVNYQHSFARMRWSAIITDEAQEYKTPSTKVSHALKALTARFRVACTGTPVETRLFDIWNLFDFLQPGTLLGSASEFRRNYESSEKDNNLPRLKERLKLGMSDAHLLRRNKEDVLDLPPKHEHYLESDLSQVQVDWHIDLLNRRSGSTPESHPFSILHNLIRVSQHPALVPRFEPTTAEDAIRSCPKLESVIECLKKIESASEKALIFTRSIDMQQLLALTLEYAFRLPVHIVNGASSKDGRRGIGSSRRSIVDAFRKSAGFNVLILSPDVAGIGLTIVEANHVIHYGRWWNPAKESQATDRVYRIGQTKAVHVYYPVAKHPQRTFPSFDEKLDSLLTSRKQLAADFLAPMPSEEDLQGELLNSLGATCRAVPHQQLLTVDDLSKMTWDRFESFVALIEGKYGRNVWLSPKSGDGGIDVVAQHGSQVRLIQCKHTQWTNAVDREMLMELISSCDAFHGSIRVSGFTFKPVLITNSSIPRAVLEFAFSRDIELVGIASFSGYLANIQCSRAEVETIERQRYSSLAQLKRDLTSKLTR
jgi:hypothetical protein